MTCQDCQRLLAGDPRKCTRAERSAVVNHIRSCKECHAVLERNVEKTVKKLPPALLPLAVLNAIIENAKMDLKDAGDPEA